MILREIYELTIELGMLADPRGERSCCCSRQGTLGI